MDGEAERRIGNLIQYGVISEIQPENGLCRVSFGTRVSPLSPWLMGRCGDDKEFWAPDLGEQALFLSPFGDGSQGVVLVGIKSNKRPLPEGAREGLYIREFRDGSRITVDRDEHIHEWRDSYGSRIVMQNGYIDLIPVKRVRIRQGE